VAAASLVYGLYFMLVSTVFLRRRTAGLPLLTLAAGAANVGANLVLIPRIGLVGAAWSTLIGYGVLTALTWWYARRSFPVSLDLPRLLLIVAVGVTAVAVAQFIAPSRSGLTLSGSLHLAVAAAYALIMLPVVWRPAGRLRHLLQLPLPPDAPAGSAPARG
jgi:O-antigen/teichoic acid export membrane protein